MASEYLRGNFTTSQCNLCHCLVICTVKKKSFLMFRQSLLCSVFCSLLPVLSLGTTKKSLALTALCPPFCTLMKIQYVCDSFTLGCPDLDGIVAVWPHDADKRGRIPSFDLLATLLVQPRISQPFFVIRACCWLVVNKVVPGCLPGTQGLLCKSSFCMACPQDMNYCLGLLLFRCRTFYPSHC